MASGDGLRTSLPREQSTDRHVLVCWNSLDDMAEREMAKLRSKKSRNEPSSSSSSQKKDQFRPSQKEFDDLVKAMPDPANVQDSLLADDGACFSFSCWTGWMVVCAKQQQ